MERLQLLLVRGNPRKNGFTQYLTDLFLEGARATGAQVQDVDLTTQALKPCLGCYHCWFGKPGSCIHHDPMEQILPLILDAQVLVCATPVYYFAMSSYLKTFFERTFPLTGEGLEVSGLGLERNRIRHPQRWLGKKLITIITGALPNREAYEPMTQTFRLIADTLDMEMAGQLVRPESHLLPYKLSKPKTIKRIEAAFHRAGQEAATNGRLTAATQQDAALPLAADLEHFRTYSNIFWGHVRDMGARSTNFSSLHQRVGSDPDILMREMVRCFDPQAAGRLQAVLQFDMPDQQRHYRVSINGGQCALAMEPTERPDLRVTCNCDIWVALFTRQLDITAALRQRIITLAGDKSLFTRLERYFPSPE